MRNADEATVDGFGEEWSAFDQTDLSREQAQKIFDDYFHIFPWSELPAGARGFDLGCGSGRWAALVAPRVGELLCIDASLKALDVAKRNLCGLPNVVFRHASVDAQWMDDESADFGYSLGVLHHVPDTGAAIRACAIKLKRGAPLLLYLYYRFDNRPLWFRVLWRCSDIVRRAICRLPFGARLAVTKVIAALIYWPLARVAWAFGRLGVNVANWPLTYYSDKTFYVMQTDALDRFGTRLEQRFTKNEIAKLLADAGLTDARFSSRAPFWCVVAFKAGA